jgi:methionyl aminopeptidase
MLDKMRVAAKMVSGVLNWHLRAAGVSTAELDQRCHDYIVDHGGIPRARGYQGCRHTTCYRSITWLPRRSGDKPLRDGDFQH